MWQIGFVEIAVHARIVAWRDRGACAVEENVWKDRKRLGDGRLDNFDGIIACQTNVWLRGHWLSFLHDNRRRWWWRRRRRRRRHFLEHVPTKNDACLDRRDLPGIVFLHFRQRKEV